MLELTIALNGLNVARRALDIIGNNIANAGTEGYHRQQSIITTAGSYSVGTLRFGLGADTRSIERVYDAAIERTLLAQQSIYSGTNQSLTVFSALEAILGEPSDSGLSARLDEFFDAWSGLSADPQNLTLRNGVIVAAQALSYSISSIATGIQDIRATLRPELEHAAERVNEITEEIARLNQQISDVEAMGANANQLRDRRDQYLTELAEFIDIEVIEGDLGAVTVQAGNAILVARTRAFPISTGGIDQGGMEVIFSGSTGIPVTSMGAVWVRCWNSTMNSSRRSRQRWTNWRAGLSR